MSLDHFRSKKIRVFRNGDVYAPGKKLVVSKRIYRNFEQVSQFNTTISSQFLHALSLSVKLNGGAVRRVYTIKGKILNSFDELEDGGIYVATSGEIFKRVPYNLLLGEGEFSERKGQLQNDRTLAASEVRNRVHTASYFAKNV